MSGIPLETCWAFNERWNDKFCYRVASCWLFLLNHYKVIPLSHYLKHTFLSSFYPQVIKQP